MALSFQIEVLHSKEDVHLYRAVLDGGDRTLHLLLDEAAQLIVLANPEGEPINNLAMSIESGDIIDKALGESTADFSLTAAHLRSQLVKTGVAPTRIRKFFG